MKYTPRLPSENHSVTKVSPLKELAILLGGLLALVIVVYTVLGVSVELVVQRISPQTEQKIASFFLRNYDFSGDKDPQTVYLQHLIDTILTNKCLTLPYPVKVHLLDDTDTINAMALPGGHIIVYKGLVNIMQSENELSFVLGHELGHFNNRDHLRGLGRSLVFLSMATVLHAPGKGVSKMVKKVVRLTETGFSRNQESDADMTGLDVLNCVYGHVNGATHFFKHMPKNLDPGHLGHYFSSHPENEKRINALLQQAENNHYTSEALTKLALPDQSNS